MEIEIPRSSCVHIIENISEGSEKFKRSENFRIKSIWQIKLKPQLCCFQIQLRAEARLPIKGLVLAKREGVKKIHEPKGIKKTEEIKEVKETEETKETKETEDVKDIKEAEGIQETDGAKDIDDSEEVQEIKAQKGFKYVRF